MNRELEPLTPQERDRVALATLEPQAGERAGRQQAAAAARYGAAAMTGRLTMTAAQTRLYDDWSDLGVAMLRRLQRVAQQQADATGLAVEICTADGLTADWIEPKCDADHGIGIRG